MKIFSGILSLLFSIISTILAIVSFTMPTGLSKAAEYYGGDAYTGIQQAAAQGANNTIYLADICSFGFGALLLIAGFGFFLYALYSFSRKKAVPSFAPPGMPVPPQFSQNFSAPSQAPFTAPPIQNVPVQTPPVQTSPAETSPEQNPLPPSWN